MLTISKLLKETWKRVEKRENRCIKKKPNQTPKKLYQTPSNQTKPAQLGQKIGPNQPAKVHGGSMTPIGQRLPPKMMKLKSKKGF